MLHKFIEDKLKATKKLCKYKIAHEPKGWTSVNMKCFAKELAKEIEHKLKSKKFLP